LRRRDLEPLSASYVLTHQLIIDAYHIIAGLFVLCPVVLIQLPGTLFLFGSFHPANVIVISLAAMRAGKTGGFDFLALVKDIAFMHHRNILTRFIGWDDNFFDDRKVSAHRGEFSQIFKRENAGIVRIRKMKIERIAAHYRYVIEHKVVGYAFGF